MSVLTLNVDEVMRTLSAESSNPFVVHDKEVDIVRFAINSGFADIVLDGQVALRVMYQRPGETEVRAQTLTYYDTDGLRSYYDWHLLSADLSKKGTLTVALCILRTDSDVEEWHTTPCQIRVLDTIHTDDSDEADETITPTVAQRVAVLESVIRSMAGGAPVVVASTSAMTDTDQLYVLTTDGKWYYYDGAAWTAGGEYGGVAVGSVTTDKLANKSVTTAKLDDSSVTWQKLASGAVHTGELADSAVTNVKLADSSVSEEKLASSAVTATQLADGAVATAKIADGAVTTAKIADGTVTAEKIASGVIPAVDTTLAQTGAAADAKAVGDGVNGLQDNLSILNVRVQNLEKSSSGISGQAAQLLVGLLQKAVYTANVSADINTLYELLTNKGEIVIPATSVSLSETTVTILDVTKTVQLVANPVPSVTTDTPVWRSTDEDVATVSANGLVTAVGDGECVIKCTYGSVFAECSVHCTLGADLIYMLSTPFTGDGSTVIDTGWKIAGADNPDSGYNTDFTIVYDVELTAIPSSMMYFVDNVDSANRTYLADHATSSVGNARFVSNTLNTQRANSEYTKNIPIRAKCVRTHASKAREMSEYFYYVTGDTLTKIENFIEASAAILSREIDNTVILGGKQNIDGTISSYMDSSITIHDFKIYKRILSTSEISEYLGKDVTA